MVTAPTPICQSCVHLQPGDNRLDRNPDAPGVVCAAFPTGIPDAIWLEGFDHRQPYPGDRDVRWELAPGAEADLAVYEATPPDTDAG